jgi:drug/metabolite transporter (DMT)-like permease
MHPSHPKGNPWPASAQISKLPKPACGWQCARNPTPCRSRPAFNCCTAAGLLFAPAAHAGALFPGVMPLMVALLAAALLREEFTSKKIFGFALILPGVLAIVWASGSELGSSQNIGHGLFLGAGLAWAFYTIAMRKARLDGLHAAAISAVGSMLIYMPIYLLMAGTKLAVAPWSDALLGIPIHGEWPTSIDWAAICMISTGVYVVSGGPLPRLSR